MRDNNDLIVGIDFGTSTSAIAFVKDGSPTLVTMDDGLTVLPSMIAFLKSGETLVGTRAKRQAIINPDKTFRSIKRRMGEKQSWVINEEEWSVEKIASLIIKRLKDEAEKSLKTSITNAVITVPAYFNNLQREAVREAGKLADINVKRIINEPTAAAMAYGISQAEEQTILVFDFGGGTFDVSILSIADGIFEVKATGGDNMLGGDDIDIAIVDKIIKDFKAAHHIDLAEDKMAMQKLRDEAEKVKISLSDSESARMHIPFISADQHGPIHLDRTFTAAMLDAILSEIIRKIIKLAEETVEAANMEINEIDHILLVGGSTRIPAVRNEIVKCFGNKLLGGVNPIECVALGAAIQGAIISGSMENKVLVDVIPLTLGVEIEGGDTEPVISKNTPIPIGQKKTFSTIADNQTEVEIKIVQGNSNRAAENVLLGRFILDGIEIAGKGEPKVEVEFDVDVNGIMKVSAKDKKTGALRSIRIEQSVTKKTTSLGN